MRFIIYGAGAVGGTIGARLFQQGHEVILICRGAHLATVQSKGMNFLTPHEDEQLYIPAVSHPGEIEFQSSDVVFLTMKTQHTLEALLDLRNVAGDAVPIICAQNGVYNEYMACRFFTNVYGMIVMLPATFLDPGIIRCESKAASGVLDAGLFPRGVDPLIEKVTSILNTARFSSQSCADVMPWKYAKLLINLRNSLKMVADDFESYGEICEKVIDEAKACFTAAGIEYTPRDDYVKRRGNHIDPAPIKDLQRVGDSTEQSILRDTGSIEVDYLNGEIVRLGCLNGIETPFNKQAQRLANDVLLNQRELYSVSSDEFLSTLSQ